MDRFVAPSGYGAEVLILQRVRIDAELLEPEFVVEKSESTAQRS